jgi:hypothetical protein
MALITHPYIISSYNQGTNIIDFIFPVARAIKRIENNVCYFDYDRPDWWHRGQILINLSKKNNSKIEDSQSENEQLAIIDDPDGYKNIRDGPGMDFDIIGKVLLDEKFYVKPNPDKQWWCVKTQTGINGFMHKSKIKLLSGK